MQQDKRRFIKKYYLSNTSALLLPFFFGTLSLLVFIQQYSFFSLKTLILNNEYLNALQIYVLLLGIIFAFYYFLKKRIDKNVKPSLEKARPFIIDLKNEGESIQREEQQRRLIRFLDNTFNKQKYAFIVGKSGSGKSTLTSNYAFAKENEENKINVLRLNADNYKDRDNLDKEINNYIYKCLKDKEIKRNIIIFDQFERVIADNSVFEIIIDFLKEPQKVNISIAFVCMPEDYALIIERLQSKLVGEPPKPAYDVFISFKNSDSNGKSTIDSVIAEKLYDFLKEKGVNVFFSNKELEKIGNSKFKDEIDTALNSANILLAVGSSAENLNAEWVKYEWDGFLKDILSKRKKDAQIFTFYQDMNPNDMPRGLNDCQAFNASEENAYENLYNFILNSSAYKQSILNKKRGSSSVNQYNDNDEYNNDNAFEYETYFLKSLKKEQEDILLLLKSKFKLTKESKRYKFFESMLNDPNSDTISMIEMNMAIKYFEENAEESSNFFESKNPMEIIKEEYFEKVFAQTENPELAMIILYALSNCGYSGGLTISDFKNLTFSSEAVIKNILEIFREQKIIKKLFEDIADSPYVIVHDYLIRYLESYCRRKLPEQISTNIRDYCEIYNQLKTDTKNNDNSVAKIPLSKYYESSIEKKNSSNFIVFCMALLGIIVFTISIWNDIYSYGISLFFNTEYEWNHLTNAITIFAGGCAIFYVYHYLQYFAKIFFYKKFTVEWWICSFLIAGGMSCIVLSLIYSALWAAWIATGWSIIGILHLALSRLDFPNENSKKRLRGEGWLYLIVAFIIILLNISVILLEGNMYPYYIIFIVFLLLTIRQHVNTDFMLAKTCIFVNYSIKRETNG